MLTEFIKSGIDKPTFPEIFSVPRLAFPSSVIPLPKRFFSTIVELTVLPEEPTPTPAEIDPVGFSSTDIFKFTFSFPKFSVLNLTSLKILKLFTLSRDFITL